jgi:hypothetical protein
VTVHISFILFCLLKFASASRVRLRVQGTTCV